MDSSIETVTCMTKDILQLPDELLDFIFRYLGYRDLVSCSYSSWAWNGAANRLLYHNVCGRSEIRYRQLMRTLTATNGSNETEYMKADMRQQQIGRLINVIEIRLNSLYNDTWYVPDIAKLTSITPNVHTVYVCEPGMESTLTPSAFDYGSKWPNLKTLVLRSLSTYHLPSNTSNWVNVLNKLHHLNIMDADGFSEYILPSSPITLNLCSLKICILNESQYNGAKVILERCRNTLHSLMITWAITTSNSNQPLNLDDLILGLPNLKVLGLTYALHSKFTISSFGDQLEELEILANGNPHEQFQDMIGKAMKKTSRLKTLSLRGVCLERNHVPLLIRNNLATLQNLFIECKFGHQFIEFLFEHKIWSRNLTTLHFECINCSDAAVVVLRDLFPNVELLVSRRGTDGFDGRWIITSLVSLFQNLKDIKTSTMFNHIQRLSHTTPAYYWYNRCNSFHVTQFVPHVFAYCQRGCCKPKLIAVIELKFGVTFNLDQIGADSTFRISFGSSTTTFYLSKDLRFFAYEAIPCSELGFLFSTTSITDITPFSLVNTVSYLKNDNVGYTDIISNSQITIEHLGVILPPMNRGIQLHTELWDFIFQHLTYPDLVSCSYTNWRWNDVANARLYHNVRATSTSALEKFVSTVTLPDTTNKAECLKGMTRQRELGNLVKTINLVFIHEVQWQPLPQCSMSILQRVSSATPNVHTVEIRYLRTPNSQPCYCDMDWSAIFRVNWQHLKRLTMKSDVLLDETNIATIILHQLEHLDTTDARKFLNCKLLPTPTMLNLRLLKITVYNDQYDQIKTILQRCQGTLYSLAIRLPFYEANNLPLDLDTLIQGLPKLKAFALAYSQDSRLILNSFGNKIEELEIIGNGRRNDPVDTMLGHAMMKTSQLKTLSLGTCTNIFQYIPTIIQNNSTTLQNVYITCRLGKVLIANMIANNTLGNNVTTLCFECRYLNNTAVRNLAAVFPQVKYLALTRGKAQAGQQWISTKSLCTFQHLKGVDTVMYSELLDPSSYVYVR
ncbi:hypothetical protein BGW37DRAFT_470200 [Umbelopsis sp. PMI_123]|nr:hypothetical protein BGW37DRAFT_470200 [Umbelopsis sp. PMI_123]